MSGSTKKTFTLIVEEPAPPPNMDAAAKERAIGMLTAPGSTFAASMLRDLQAGLRTEHDHILGAMVRRADRLGCAAPLLKLALTHMVVQSP